MRDTHRRHLGHLIIPHDLFTKIDGHLHRGGTPTLTPRVHGEPWDEERYGALAYEGKLLGSEVFSFEQKDSRVYLLVSPGHPGQRLVPAGATSVRELVDGDAPGYRPQGF